MLNHNGQIEIIFKTYIFFAYDIIISALFRKYPYIIFLMNNIINELSLNILFIN
jgi:hypothetical protein